jgi:hypothetical protein
VTGFTSSFPTPDLRRNTGTSPFGSRTSSVIS